MNKDGFTSGQKGSFTKIINKFKNDAQQELTEIKGIKNTLKALEREILSDDDSTSIKTLITQAYEDINNYKKTIESRSSDIDNYYDDLFITEESDDEEEEPELCIKDSIEQAAKEINDHNIKTLLVRNRLVKADKTVNGYEIKGNEEDGTEERYVPGLIDELQGQIKRADEFHTNQNEITEKLYKKINDLLAGATSASLATSYENQKATYSTPNRLWSMVFMFSMITMAFVGYKTIPHFNDFTDAIKSILARLPIFGALIWLGLFASKQQSQNKRLEQEYAHKASLAKSFEGYKQQIIDLSDDGDKEEILEKLINNIIEAVNHNPSNTLDSSYHVQGSPLNITANDA